MCLNDSIMSYNALKWQYIFHISNDVHLHKHLSWQHSLDLYDISNNNVMYIANDNQLRFNHPCSCD